MLTAVTPAHPVEEDPLVAGRTYEATGSWDLDLGGGAPDEGVRSPSVALDRAVDRQSRDTVLLSPASTKRSTPTAP